MSNRLRRSSLTAAIVALAALGAPTAVSAQSDAPVDPSAVTLEIEGTITAAVIDDLGRTPGSTTAYAVTTDDGSVVPISTTRDLPPNGEFTGELVIEGDLAESLDDQGILPDDGGTIAQGTSAAAVATATAADQAQPLPVAEASVAPAAAVSASATPSAHKAYVVKMTDQGSVDGTDAAVAAEVDDMLSYWVKESDGAITSFARQGAILDYNSAANYSTSQSCGMLDPFTIWDDAERKFPGVDFYSPGNHLIVLVGDECGESGPVGVATIGSSLSSGGPSIVTFDPKTFDSTGAHELGHNFGLDHANLDTCPSSNVCEYYDLYSPMGMAIAAPPAYAPPALGTLYREELGLTTSSEVATVPAGAAPATRTFSLAPRGSATGLRGLLVTDPSTGTTYSVDLRARTGRDSRTFYGNTDGYTLGAPSPTVPVGVVIERQDAREETYLMTRTVGGRLTGAFAAGTTFSPSPRLSVKVTALGTTNASVEVTTGEVGPIASSTPTITGTPAVGRSVSASPGTWTEGAAFTYDWKLDGVSTGVTTKSYTLPASALGKDLTVTVTGTKTGYTAVSKTSSASQVASGTLTAGTPSISGTVAVGKTLTATAGTWSPTPDLSYEWLVDGVAVGTGTTYVVPAADRGKSLRLAVTGTRTGYDRRTVTTAGATVAYGRLVTKTPTISGTAKVGRTLKVSRGTWTSGTTLTQRWYASGKAISGATSTSLKLKSAQRGKKITVKVTGKKPGYLTASKTSSSTRAVAR